MKKKQSQEKPQQQTEKSVRFGSWISVVSTAVLIFLMALYLIMNISSSASLAEQTEIISDHPFEVVISAGDLKLYVSEMSLRTERLQRHRSAEDIESSRTALAQLMSSVQEPLSRVENLYLGDQKDVQAFKDTLGLLQEAQNEFLLIAAQPDVSDAEIEAYELEHLSPLYERLLEQAAKIISIAQERKVGYGEKAESLRQLSLSGSFVLMGLMVAVLLISQLVLYRQRKELIHRSRLFDSLSLSIDDAFIIRDIKTNAINYRGLNLERVLGDPIADVGSLYKGLKPEDAQAFREGLVTLQSDMPLEKLVEYTKPDRQKRWMLIRVYRVDNLHAPQLITVFSDRTKEVLSRKAIQDAMLTAEKANAAKSDFLSRMSHEIRTPLNAIIGMTTIAAASVEDAAKVEDCLSKITYSSKHLLMLINDVLDMSKIESSKMVLQNESFDVFEAINGFVSTIYAQAKAKNIDFQEMMEGFGDKTVFIGDSLRLTQILLNIGSNAVKFTPPGGRIRLEVSRIAVRNATDTLRFSLSDTGIGMTQEAIERIFKPFEQADASIAKRYGGTGLGMSITKNLVALMGGKIHVESEPGKGTTCTVDLPFRKANENDISAPDFGNQALRALVVDDERQVCEQTSALLEKIKICSEWRLSGIEAVDRVKETYRTGQAFDLCLIDWKMPDIDGVEVTRRIRREVGDDLPIVMISAYDISEVEKEARQAGVNGFLPKPLYRSSVYAAIKDALEHKNSSSASEAVSAGLPLEGRRLLIAEDNALNQEIAATLLRMNGAVVECANDGRQALDQFLQSSPGYYDAILMDVQMPVMDGLEATRSVRISDHPFAKTIPIIATTANAFSDDVSMALAAGMSAHISKPLDIGQLCRTLSECIRIAESKRTN